MAERLRPGPLLWAAWALLSIALLFLVARCARNVPYWDDWKLVPVLLGGQPAGAGWLWEQGNEHRLPLSKAVLWTLTRLSGGDLRWTMAVAACALSALAAFVLRTLSRLTARTGGLRWTDLALLLALLGWGQHDSVLWVSSLHFVLAAALFLSALMLMLRLAEAEAVAEAERTAAAAPESTAALALPAAALGLLLASGAGLVLAPVLVLWMGWASRHARAPALRRALGLGALLSGAVGLLLLLKLPSSPASNPGFMGLAASAATALRCLATAFGPVGREWWPWSGVFAALLDLATLALLLRVVLREPARRLGASVLLAGVLALSLLALVIGVTRAGLGWEAGFAPRYTTLTAPWLCCVLLAWRLHGSETSRRLLPAILCLVLGVALPFNTLLALRQADAHARALETFAQDVAAGSAPEALARAHGEHVCPSEAKLIACLRQLRAERRWLYAKVAR